MKNSVSKYILLALVAVLALNVNAKKKQTIAPSYAWTVSDPLGLQYPSTIDTLSHRYHDTAIPSFRSKAWATTGNYGTEGQDQIFFDRVATSEFFFEDALSTWLESITKQRFYNTRIPMTLLSHTTGGDKYSNQDRTIIDFSGNASKRLQIGAMMDYIYSKGSYDVQAQKNFKWNLSASYMGDRYELQTFFHNYNHTNKENGGITDDRYITDPAQVQGGESKINAKDIPTNLSDAYSVLEGHEFYMNHRYKVGYYHYYKDTIKTEKGDSIADARYYVPVTSFIWTFDYKNSFHKFLNKKASEDLDFFPNTYLNAAGTDEFNRYNRIRNTIGISMLEGFNKWAKFGFAVYAQHEIRRYTQVVTDSIDATADLDPLPCTADYRHTDNLFWVGGQLTKQHGSILRYNASAQFGILGDVKGDMDINGDVTTRIHMLGDTVSVRGYGYFKNLEAPYLLKHYVSNHYAWDNSFSKETRFRVGGELNLPFSGTNVNVGYETLKNYIYFGTSATPEQCSSPIHVLSATLKQNLHVGILHWDTELTYQTTSNDEVLPLPKFSVYSNLYMKFTVAKVLHSEIGVDGNYYTSYYAPAYNPATMSFYNQRDTKCGNFAFLNVYANFRMKQARFFVAYTHVNKGSLGKAYFSIPHYPLNPARFQIGVSVNFVN